MAVDLGQTRRNGYCKNAMLRKALRHNMRFGLPGFFNSSNPAAAFMARLPAGAEEQNPQDSCKFVHFLPWCWGLGFTLCLPT